MMNRVEVPALGYELNPFLFASIGSKSGRTQMSVMSALLKINSDPWREAADLAKLPREEAVERLSGLLTKAVEPPMTAGDRMNFRRLVALLPQLATPEARRPLIGEAISFDWRTALCLVVLTAIAAAAVIPVFGR